MGAILIIVSLLILLINILVGVFRGTGRCALRLGTLVLSALLAFLLAKGLSSAMAGLFVPMLEDMLSSNETLAEFVNTNPEMPDLIRALAQMLVAPILFLLIYMLLKMITFIVYFILRKALRISGPRKVGSFLGGAGIGLLIGLIGLIVFSTPVVGYGDFVNRTAMALDSAEAETETDAESADLATYNEQYIKPLAETPIAGLAYTMLGDTLFDSLTTTEWNGADASLETEWFAIVGVVKEAGKLTDRPVAEYGAGESAAVHAMITNLGGSRILTYLGGNTLSGMAGAWLEQRPFFGVTAPAMEDANAQLLFNGILRVFATTGPEQLTGDLDFFADLFDLMVEHQLFAQFAADGGENDLVQQMVASGFLDEVYALINSNPRMQPVSKAIHDVGMNILVAELGLPEDYKENHEKLMNDMTTALQDSVTEEGEIDTEKLQASLNEAFADSGVEIDSAAAEVIADGLSEVFTPEELAGGLTPEQITDRLIERFADAESIESMIPDGVPTGTLPEGTV